MVKKINRSVILIILFVSIFIIGNQVAIRQYEKSTSKLLLEYHEMLALEEFKVSLRQFENNYLESNHYDPALNQADSLWLLVEVKKEACENKVSDVHKSKWEQLLRLYENLHTTIHAQMYDTEFETVKGSIDQITMILDYMINETVEEIAGIKNRNITLRLHSTITLLSAGIIFIIIIAYLSIKTGQDITQPIKEFLSTFKKLSAGKLNARASVQSTDEFGELAKEFNKLFDHLNEQTVTIEYFRNIIDSIYGALFVIDKDGQIRQCNKTVVHMLGYTEEELIGTNIASLLEVNVPRDQNTRDGDSLRKALNKAEVVTRKNGSTLPVLTTCTRLETKDQSGLIVVMHDIAEKIEYQRQLEESKRKALVAINEAQEAERGKLATELHDSLGQKLSAVFYALQNMLDGKLSAAKIKDIQSLVNEAIGETRSISHSIMPGVLRDFGLVAALNELINTTNRLQDVSCTFNHFGFENRVDEKIEKVLFRICQEALQNILKHSKAKHATFQLFKSDGLVTLTIEDDGTGFDPKKLNSKEPDGIGLLGIRERVAYFNGVLTINSSRKNGTEIIVEIPYK